MFTPLITIAIESIYDGKPLPVRMAKCTPDMYSAIAATKRDLEPIGAALVLSDLFRSYDMQLQANLDYVTGKKTAYSPPPGGSMHEAGRAFDLDLKRIKKLTLAKFWPIASKRGLFPIIDTPDVKKSEAWHFDCRGSHDLVYKYYAAGKGDNFRSAYTAMAASAIVSLGQKVDALGEDPRPGYIQSGLIRMGNDIGDLDGHLGPKTRNVLNELGIDESADVGFIAGAIDRKLQEQFPTEFFVAGVYVEADERPRHVIG